MIPNATHPIVPCLDVARLEALNAPPPLFAPGEPLFWDDPHISEQMLAYHLNPDTEAASRPPAEIAQTVAWLVGALGLESGDAVLDLGCGPGLYAVHLAEHGLRVTGVDYSRRSIAYARQQADARGLPITYRYQDYRTLDDPPQYDAALLIYGDFCVLSDPNREAVLKAVYRALKPGGLFAFDVTTRALRARYGVKPNWYATPSGFWKPGPHLVLERGFDYPDADCYLDQFVVIEPDGHVSVYRNWFHDYTPETIAPVVEAQGFAVRGQIGSASCRERV